MMLVNELSFRPQFGCIVYLKEFKKHLKMVLIGIMKLYLTDGPTQQRKESPIRD